MMSHLFWYLARSSGFMTYGCAWGAVVWGLLLTTRLAPQLDRTATYLIHRLLGIGSILFLGVHFMTLYLDPWAHFSLWDLLVPFAASYRPVWLACGVVAAYLLGAIVLTSMLKARLRVDWWLGVHYLAYLTVALGLVHGLGSGSDTGQPWARAVYAGSAAIIAVLWIVRIGWGRQVARGAATVPWPNAAKHLDPAMLALGQLRAKQDKESDCLTAPTSR
jgi:sulfoxide reductase heme-binding subunit YedZ